MMNKTVLIFFLYTVISMKENNIDLTCKKIKL
jgi:hypothetical protein